MDAAVGKLINTKVSTSVTIIVMFTYTILMDQDFPCTCRGQSVACWCYVFLPSLIVFLLLLWASNSFQAVYRYSGIYWSCGSCIHLISKLLPSLSICALWVVFVFVDGDWYVCCMNDHSDKQKLLACLDEKNRTIEEQSMISELKNESRIIAGFGLLGIISLGLSLKLGFFCCKSGLSNRKHLYYRMILEEEDNILKTMLKKSAIHSLTKEIQTRLKREKWEKCFSAAEDLAKIQARPEVFKREEQGERRDMDNQELGMNPEDMMMQEHNIQKEDKA